MPGPEEFAHLLALPSESRKSLREMREAVVVYMTRAAERLRVTVFINTNRFSPEPQYANSASHELVYSTDSADELLGWVLMGLEKIFREGYRYKKAGAMSNRLVPADQQSRRIFGHTDYERSRRLMKAVDEINAWHGHDTVRLGLARPDAPWKTKFLRRSLRYTTRLKEVLSIR